MEHTELERAIEAILFAAGERVEISRLAMALETDENEIAAAADALADTPYLEAFGFEENGVLAGYGMVAMSYSTEAGGRCAWIEDIYIEPAYRGKGFGTRFLAFVKERYEGQVARIRLEAEPENERAMAVYRKAGFEILGYTQLVKEL